MIPSSSNVFLRTFVNLSWLLKKFSNWRASAYMHVHPHKLDMTFEIDAGFLGCKQGPYS